ncbi:NAD(P)-dependent oxidoreductase [Paenibacillus arenilitoris]|uniref:NAD(P)H-binding protein n=1 Tax=Paenibacillus arenilitoris TaxID=2772299 RepID=A0A927CJY2_9BACL|nr:NAD(P)H-binding protein [Paenibacillus arenilitoris]MBD2868845.1 NAD(P)H-binding protein [Paenibacillus arenilitoris]
MNITLFGASGAIGKIVLEEALRDTNNTVTAYVRNPDRLKTVHPNVKIIVGELGNQALVHQAIEHSDVIISTLGPALSRKIKGTPVADGHEAIINAMKKLNKKRLITLATPTLQSDEDKKQFSTVFPGIMAKLFLPSGYLEMKKMEKLIKHSPLDWTVVRIINPNVNHRNQEYAFSFGDKPAKMGVSRENVGKFMYRVAKENLYSKKMPIIFNR